MSLTGRGDIRCWGKGPGHSIKQGIGVGRSRERCHSPPPPVIDGCISAIYSHKIKSENRIAHGDEACPFAVNHCEHCLLELRRRRHHGGQPPSLGNLPAQIEGVSSDVRLVTIIIGGNDVGDIAARISF